jgi:hypothetical protein
MLQRRPSQLRIIATLEIVVRDENGAYLLVVYPDYTGAESDFPTGGGTERFAIASSEPGEWTPPYRTYNVIRVLDQASGLKNRRSASKLPCKTDELFKLFDEAQKHTDPEGDLYTTAEGLGLRSTDIEEVETFHEFRPSYRHPEDFRGYRIIRFVSRLGEDDFLNVADPEMRKGLAFLPIDDVYQDLPERQCENHGRPERLFWGRPIANNLRTTLEGTTTRESLVHNAPIVDKNRFFSAETGLVLAADLAGYGKCCAFVDDEGAGFGVQDPDVSAALRNTATVAFSRLFLRSSIYQTHTAGDGILCAIPKEELDADPGRLARFFAHYHQMLDEIESINGALMSLGESRSKPAPQLGSRLAIHYGSYRFGKTSLFGSLAPAFDGASIIHAARLEAGLRDWLKSGGHTDARHSLAVSVTASVALNEHLDLRQWAQISKGASIGAKEYKGEADIFARTGSSD